MEGGREGVFSWWYQKPHYIGYGIRHRESRSLSSAYVPRERRDANMFSRAALGEERSFFFLT